MELGFTVKKSIDLRCHIVVILTKIKLYRSRGQDNLSFFVPELAFCFLAFFINFFWEVIHTYFYTLKFFPFSTMLYHWLHCTLGDVAISLGSFWLVSLACRTRRWLFRINRLKIFGFIMVGVIYTIISELVNVNIYKSWDYNQMMPIIPWIKVGLTPVLQWIIIPPVVIFLVRHHFYSLFQKQSNAGKLPNG